MKRKGLIYFLLLTLLLLSSCGGKELSLEEALAVEIVDDRPEVLHFLGLPDAFDISIVEVEGGWVRMESWRYFDFGTRIDFVDGEAVWTFDLEPVPEDTLFPAWYNPLSFEDNISPGEASRLVAAASPAGAAPESLSLAEGGEGLENGALVVGDQIILGFDGDQLVYVETVALYPEGGHR
jgi:hypothetical protein